MTHVDVLRQPDKLPEQFVSWLRRFISDNSMISAKGTGGGSSTPSTKQVQFYLDAPGSSQNAFPLQSATSLVFSNVRRLIPAFANGGDGTWEGSFRIPQDYSSAGKIIIAGVCDATTGNVRVRVSTSVVANGASLDPSYTDESYANHTVPGAVNKRDDITFTLTTTPVAGSTMNVKVTRNGASGSDTLAAIWGVYEIVFQYTST